MNTVYVRQLVDARAKAHASAVQFIKDGLNTGNRDAYNRAMDEVDRLAVEIRRAEAGEHYNPAAILPKESRENREKHAVAFLDYLRNGIEMSTESRKVLREVEHRDGQTEGTQAITNTTGSAGGYFVPTSFVYNVEQALKYFCPFLGGGVCRVIETASGQTLPFPTGDDTSNEGETIGESATVNAGSVTVGSVSLAAWKLSSKIIKVSSELLQDSAFDFEAYLAERFGERLGRAMETLFTTGDGNAKPTGILTALAALPGFIPVAAVGSNANDASGSTGANSVGYADLVAAEHAVDPSYRNSKSARFMFSDHTLAGLKQLLDKFGRPLWQSGIAVGAPDTLLGYQYVINQKMPNVGPSKTPVLFGDLSKFVVRKVAGLRAVRLQEVYAANDQIGFVSYTRVDSNYIHSGGNAISLVQNNS